MTTMEKDTLARLRHEMTTHRASARRLDLLARSTHDPLMRLHYAAAARERRAFARAVESDARQLRDRVRTLAIERRYRDGDGKENRS